MQKPDSIAALHRYAAALIEANEQAETSAAFSPMPNPTSSPDRRLRLRSRVGLLAAALVVGNVGLAAASDSAIPGDLLYPIDRGYETLAGFAGIEIGGGAERIEEAYLLLANGDADEAIAVATEAVPAGAPEQRAILNELAAEIARTKATDATSDKVHTAVADLLQAVHDISSGGPPGQDEINKDQIRDRARAVAEAARGRPFDPGQGPGSGINEPKADTEGADRDRDRSVDDSADKPKGGNGPVENPGQGKGLGRDKRDAGNSGGGRDKSGQGNGQGRGNR